MQVSNHECRFVPRIALNGYKDDRLYAVRLNGDLKEDLLIISMGRNKRCNSPHVLSRESSIRWDGHFGCPSSRCIRRACGKDIAIVIYNRDMCPLNGVCVWVGYAKQDIA